MAKPKSPDKFIALCALTQNMCPQIDEVKLTEATGEHQINAESNDQGLVGLVCMRAATNQEHQHSPAIGNRATKNDQEPDRPCQHEAAAGEKYQPITFLRMRD